MKIRSSRFPAGACKTFRASGIRTFGETYVRLAVFLVVSAMLLCTEESTGPVETYEPTSPVWGAVEGVVVDRNGTPIRGAGVYSIPGRSLNLTDSQGKFRLDRLDTISYGLAIRRVGFADLDTFTDTSGNGRMLRILNGDTTISVGQIKMQSRGTELAGRVMLSGGAPAVGAGVEIVSEDRRVRTDGDGRFTIGGLLSDTGTVMAALTGEGWGAVSYSLSENGAAPIMITLDTEGAVIEGRIVGKDNVPMGRVVVRAVAGGLIDTTDSADGSFRITDVPVGESVRLISDIGHVVEGLIADPGGTLAGVVLSGAHMVKWKRLGVGSVKILTQGVPAPRRVTVFLDTLPVPAPDTAGLVDSGTISDTSTTQSIDMASLIFDTVGYYVWDRNSDGQIDTITGSNFIEDHSLATPVSYGAVTLDGHLIRGARIEAVKIPDSLRVHAPDTVFGTSDTTVALSGTAERLRGGIARYSWDFDGDGAYDTTITHSGRVEYHYKTPDTYGAVFLVESTENERDSSFVTVIISEPAPEPGEEPGEASEE